MQKRAKACRALKKATASDVQIHAAAEAIINAEIIYPRLRVGGDRTLPHLVRRLLYFNPRLRVGGDSSSTRLTVSPLAFQSTPPRGRRLLLIICLGHFL